MYYKPTTALVKVFNEDNPDGIMVQAAKVGIRTFTENAGVGKATVRYYYLDDQDNDLAGDMWLTTNIPDMLVLVYRKILNGTATSGAIDTLTELILNSPEGNAAITS